METTHKIYFEASQNMSRLSDESVNLVITSPPYPMIEMWDAMMSEQNPEIKNAFDKGNVDAVFELMHCELVDILPRMNPWDSWL